MTEGIRRGIFCLTVLMILVACAKGHSSSGKDSREIFQDAGLRKLADAACNGDKPAIQTTIAEGVKPNGIGLEGITPLIWATSCGSIDGVDGLIAAGADVNLGSPPFLPVSVAASRDNSTILRHLLRAGANPNPVLPKGSSTPLKDAFYATVAFDNIDNLDALLEYGADPNQRYCDGPDCDLVNFAVNTNRPVQATHLLKAGYRNCDDDLIKVARGYRASVIELRPDWDKFLAAAELCQRARKGTSPDEKPHTEAGD